MDRSKCWVQTVVTVVIEHCPSVTGEIAKETDRIINYTMKGTDLTRFGKTHVQVSHNTITPVDGE